MRWTKWGFTANESFFLFFLPTIAGYQQLSFIKSLFPIPSQRKWIPEALLELKSSDRSNQLCLMVCTALLERNAQLCRRRQKPIKFFAAYLHLCSTHSTLHLKATCCAFTIVLSTIQPHEMRLFITLALLCEFKRGVFIWHMIKLFEYFPPPSLSEASLLYGWLNLSFIIP